MATSKRKNRKRPLSPFKSARHQETSGTVQGTLVNEDGGPIAGARLSLFSEEVRSETHLGDATSGKQGEFSISYQRSAPLNLAVRAYDASGKVTAQSPTVFAADAAIQIDITTAASGVVHPPSTFTTLNAEVTAQLRGISFSDLRENQNTHELQFLASAIGSQFDEVAELFIAHALGAQNKIQEETLFGLFYQGIPASLSASLANLPATGIEATFMAPVLAGVLAQSRGSLSQALTAAVNANVLPASYTATQDAQLSLLDDLRTQSTSNSAYGTGTTSLNDLLAAGGVTAAVKTAFTQAYANNGGQAAAALAMVQANRSLPGADIATLSSTLELGTLLSGNIPLIKDTLNRISQKSLAAVQNLALLDQSDWVARITAMDPKGTSVLPASSTSNPEQNIAQFAATLATTFANAYPTTAFAGGLSKAQNSSFAKTKSEIGDFITANPDFSLQQTNIDQFIFTHKSTISAPAIADMKTAQRLARIASSQYSTVDALNAAGYGSAQEIYFKGRDPFVAQMTTVLGGGASAQTVFARAQMTYAIAITAFGRYNLALNGINISTMQSPVPPPDAIADFPDLQALFGSLDYFECEDCQSVYSPAAYLVDLLTYLKRFAASGLSNPNATAADALFLRRPDIQYIALNCNNTNITLPYIDVANEILEAAIAPPSPSVTFIDTTGTSDERRALPQQISQAAYALTAGVVYPLSLPFDLAFAQTTAYLQGLGTSRAAVLTLFAGNPAGPSAGAIAGTTLGINPSMQAVIDGTDTHQSWDRWGLPQNPASVVDPKTGAAYTPNPTDWVAALSKVPVLLNRTGLSIQQLYQLLEVIWVTQSSVTLQLGTTTIAGLQVLSPDTDAMIFVGLTADVLDRANRFFRLWSATGLQMWELDWALEAASGGILNDTFLAFLVGALAVQKQLNLPFQEILSLWMPLETRDVTSHLGEQDTVVASTYSKVFRNAAVLASWGNVFVPLNQSVVTAVTNATPIAVTTAKTHGYQTGMQVAVRGVQGNTAANGSFTITVTGPATFTLDGSTGNGVWTSGGIAVGILSGNMITSSSPIPTPEQSAVTAALGLSPNDISAILAFTGAANSLSLDTLNVLLQFQRLAASLSLEIADLIEWIQLTGGKPFGSDPFNGKPADTLEFCRRLSVLQGTGLAVHDLDFLLRGQSAAQSSLAFTPTQSTAVLQAIRDALAKLPTATTIPVTGVSAVGSTIAISTAQPAGLQTGTQVTITGVQGMTAANGAFTITVTGPSTFTLNGSSPNGSWTGGGIISVNAYDSTTIQTIFVSALAAATQTTANVVIPILDKIGVLPLDPNIVSLLLAQTTGVDPTQFPTLTGGFTSVAKAAALFSALKPSESEFAFVVQNAGAFNWLDPSALTTSPVTATPYVPFESLLRALKLNQRQSARSPKLFDILAQWLLPNSLPSDLPTAIGGPTITVIAASNSQPIKITTAAPHRLQTGMEVTVSGAVGNTAANGSFTIAVTDSITFSLDGSSGNGTWTSGGTVVAAGLACLALALNATVNDVSAIATALGAKPPSLVAATQPGTLGDIATLTSIATALDVVDRYLISGTALVQLAATPATSDTASAAMGALQGQYPQNAWFGAIQPVEDILRQNRRDALVAYLLGPGPAAQAPPLLTTDDIFNYYLIDPEMLPCASTTRLLQASLAIQQFVQQCFLNLFFFSSDIKINMAVDAADEWSWRQQYRLWQANRQIFLYPENYVLPETRSNSSSFFADLESDVRQSNCDEDAAEKALENYLRKLVGVSRLQIAAHYNETKADGSHVLHVFGRTRGKPPQWYYRTRTDLGSGGGTWSAWQLLNLDINSQHLVPVVWDRRLHLFWPIFTQISEKQSDQDIPPSTGGGPQPAPIKFWAIEFAMSELSSGQWQPKRTISEKAYINSEDSPLAFTFRAFQDSFFNLQLRIYLTEPILFYGSQGGSSGSSELDPGLNPTPYLARVGTPMPQPTQTTSVKTIFDPNDLIYHLPLASELIATATLPIPESPLSIVELSAFLPSGQYIDTTQEPTYMLVNVGPMSGQLPTPAQYGFSAQDMVFGNYSSSNSGQQVLNVLQEVLGQTTSVELLGTITNPRIVVPQQELIFNSTDPFFVTDSIRTYLVQPFNRSVATLPQQSGVLFLAQISPWSTTYMFETFYHPYARTFLRELEVGGVPQMMARTLQTSPQTVRGWTPVFDFQSLYNPQPPVVTPYPGAPGASDPGETTLDFAAGSSGAYSLYNWEVFYHIPMFMASLLMQNQQYSDAMTWLEYIFNPTDSSLPSPQNFWQMAPLNAMNSSDWIGQEIQNILNTLAADVQQGINDAATIAAIDNWLANPFDPHAVASLRISAYGKATVMKFLDNLIAWGDWYYSQYTAEMVGQAEQLYILADMILGPKPQMLRSPNANQGSAGSATYASVSNQFDPFSNVLVNIENLVVAPEAPQSLVQGTSGGGDLPQFPGSGSSLLFCIPPNDKLLAYWDTVAQRLYNIRHCLNMQGVAQPLPLYAPLNPLQLAEEEAGQDGYLGRIPPAPIYRFAVYLQKAIELTNDIRAYGSLILSALEKQDAETLAVLRSNQELDIQTRVLDVKALQATEANDQITALQNQKAVVQIRYNFYSTIAFTNAWEIAALELQAEALILNGMAVILDLTSSEAHMVPTAIVGVSGFGGTPQVTVSFGGENVAASAASAGSAVRSIAGIYTELASMVGTGGSYQRRMDEWNLQANLAAAELTQMDSQIAAAIDRFNIANNELSIQNAQISNTQAVSNFLTNKYTNAQLYSWMISQLTTVYVQAYQLAFSLALQAQNAFQYELGTQDTFIQFGYWDNQHKGLTAGESLLFDLRRMEAQYLAANSRELELTRHISLALTLPQALVMLRETGTCQIALDELLFDGDHPGQYFRRLRSVALTVPCVVGPYTGVNATLSLTKAMVRVQSPGTGYQPQSATAAPNDPSVVLSPTPAVGSATIATSTGQNDAGLFDVNLRDDRWLPFEGQGLISTWNLVLDPRDNNFDFETITDVILHVRYTARGGDQTAANNVRAALLTQTSRSILVSVRHTFSDAYYSFFNPANGNATEQTLTLGMTNVIFPFSNIGTGGAKIENIAIYVALSVPAAGNTLAATFGPTGGAAAAISLAPAQSQTGAPMAALTATVSPGVAAPQTFALTVPIASLPPGLGTTVNGQTLIDPTKIEDILLIITYSIE